ncbi:hypothetical protein GQ473_06705 [archaeon]|nr:hypothetical protein [archaeon]
MNQSKIFFKETNKSTDEIVKRIKELAKEFGFIVRYNTNMVEEYKTHNVDVRPDMKYRTIMLCIPQKAYNSVISNSKRASLIMPKQISIYKDKDTKKTIISHLMIGSDFLKEVLPDDEMVQKSIPASCKKVVELIKLI